MDWIHNKKPTETGSYLVSVKRNRKYGNQAFIYVAHYDIGNDKWYTYDPFDDDYMPSKELEGVVSAWSNDIPVYLS